MFKSHCIALMVVLLTAILPAATQQPPLVDGRVMKIDQPASKITIKHGPIKNLDMNEDGMTMVFAVQDPKMLTTTKVGDKIRFTAERVNGIITVTKIQK